jgi:predicted dehydrogenase
VAGRGHSNLEAISALGARVAALCDVDSERLDKAAKAHPRASTYSDFRLMLEQKDVDAVVVSTPDHAHATIALAAMALGKHVYVEKPLAHNIYEARKMLQASRRYKVATQMGNQHHAQAGLRSQVELVQSGAIGAVREVHVYTDRPIWPQGINRPTDAPACPATIAWDLWLGPAPQRAYHPAYMPFKWRGWWDFGTGALGDMGCHLIDAPFWALDLRDPVSLEASVDGGNQESGPKRSTITYDFPARGSRGPVKMVWYDGGRLPPREITDDQPLVDKKNGIIYVGKKGTLFGALGGAAKPVGVGAAKVPTTAPSQTLPRSPGHHEEFLIACMGGDKASSNFEYAVPLTETVLLGNLAIRAGRKIKWDSEKMETDSPQATQFVRREYRQGWEL